MGYLRKAVDINPLHQQIAAFLLKVVGYNRCGKGKIQTFPLSLQNCCTIISNHYCPDVEIFKGI